LGELEVVPVQDSKRLTAFLEFPYRLYRNSPFWAPPLRIAQKELFDVRKHPFWANADASFFLARRGGETVARVAAIVDRNHNRIHGEDAGFFGFFESAEDPAAAAAVLGAACDWLR